MSAPLAVDAHPQMGSLAFLNFVADLDAQVQKVHAIGDQDKIQRVNDLCKQVLDGWFDEFAPADSPFREAPKLALSAVLSSMGFEEMAVAAQQGAYDF